MPPTSWVLVPVTTIVSFSNSTEPVDWANAVVGVRTAAAVHSSEIYFMLRDTPKAESCTQTSGAGGRLETE